MLNVHSSVKLSILYTLVSSLYVVCTTNFPYQPTRIKTPSFLSFVKQVWLMRDDRQRTWKDLLWYSSSCLCHFKDRQETGCLSINFLVLMRAAKLGSCMQALFRKNTSACLPAWLVGGDLIYYSELARTETKKRCRSPADAKGYYLQGWNLAFSPSFTRSFLLIISRFENGETIIGQFYHQLLLNTGELVETY